MTVMIAIAKPFVGMEEKEAVCKVIDSGMIACGAVVEQFEKEFAAYVGAEYGIATTSGTTALEVAIRSLGIGPGDKVLTTPFSFIASTNALSFMRALRQCLRILTKKRLIFRLTKWKSSWPGIRRSKRF